MKCFAVVSFMALALAMCVQCSRVPMYNLNPVVKITKPERNGNLIELAESLDLTTLVDEAKRVDIAQMLETAPSLTLFGPTNEAFETIPDPIKPFRSNATIFKWFLLFHVVKDKFFANEIKNELLVPSILESDPKFFIRFNVYDEVVTAQCSKIIKVNQNASNGVLHVVDRLMILTNDTAAGMVSSYRQYYGKLYTALVKTNLMDLFAAKGPFTVFAPTDWAFAKIPADKLKKIFADIPLLTKILKYHIVPGTFCTAGLRDGTTLTTLEGSDITVHVSSKGTYVINDDAPVVYPDASMTNGVVQVLNTVLLPKDLDI